MTYSGWIQPLYGVVIHHACQSRNLEEMKAVAQRAEEYLAAAATSPRCARSMKPG
ncbi:MAG: DUF1843 domain-containing protein [Pseudonocardiaceae bacterium]